MIHNKKSRVSGLITMGLAALFTLSAAEQAAAKGGPGGGRTFDLAFAEGNCMSTITGLPVTSATPSMVLRSSQGVINSIMQVIGTDAVGTWNIAFTMNGVAGTIYSNLFVPPPGGFAVTGDPVTTKSVKVTGVATNPIKSISCSATVNKVF